MVVDLVGAELWQTSTGMSSLRGMTVFAVESRDDLTKLRFASSPVREVRVWGRCGVSNNELR
jgi:hypothetical protein